MTDTSELGKLYIWTEDGMRHANESEIMSAAGSISAKRQTPHAGPGRPKLPRCKCGAMTLIRAAATGHKCGKPKRGK